MQLTFRRTLCSIDYALIYMLEFQTKLKTVAFWIPDYNPNLFNELKKVTDFFKASFEAFVTFDEFQIKIRISNSAAL